MEAANLFFFFFLQQNFVTSGCTFPLFDKGADTSNTLLEAGSLKQDAPKKKKKKKVQSALR